VVFLSPSTSCPPVSVFWSSDGTSSGLIIIGLWVTEFRAFLQSFLLLCTWFWYFHCRVSCILTGHNSCSDFFHLRDCIFQFQHFHLVLFL
jgi:hypothetical protein